MIDHIPSSKKKQLKERDSLKIVTCWLSNGMANGNNVTHNLKRILSSEERDFLVRNNGDKVKIRSLSGKIVGLYFSGSWCGPCTSFTPTLVELYREVTSPSKKGLGEFEVVFVSSDENDASFSGCFSGMPWLAVPFSDSNTRKCLTELFEIRGIPSLVIIDAAGKVSTSHGTRFVREYGVDGYPFSLERIKALVEEEREAKRNQSLRSILVNGDLDYLISNGGNKILVSELEGKIIGLYFSMNSRSLCTEFTRTLTKVYNKLNEKGDQFEVVLISLDHDEYTFKLGFEAMPWLCLPYKDKRCQKLVRYFGLKALPTLVAIGRDGKNLNLNVVELIEDHGVKAYPFTPSKVLEIESAKQDAQTLESLLVSGDKDFVIAKDGSKVPISDLVGKNIILYFSAQWCPPCHAFLPKLIDAYHNIKSNHDTSFEVIFVSSCRDKSSFDKFFASMPWLALPFGDARKRLLDRRFKIPGIPSAVAIGPNGRTVNMEARQAISAHGAKAYPFSQEHLKRLEKA